MTSVQERVSQAVARTKKLWFIFMALIVVGFFVSPFALSDAIYLVPIALITYFGAIAFTIMSITKAQAESVEEVFSNPMLKELHDDLKAGRVQPGSDEMFQRMRECGVLEVMPVGRVSEDEIVGTVNGHTIYEWVEIQNPQNNTMEKFTYYSPGHYENDGTPVMPQDPNLLFAHVDGVLYSRPA